MNTPYTYFIKWTKTGMNYYGVRYAKDCHPDEFWKTYFTSSRYVAEYVAEHGDPDVIEIRKVFVGDDRCQQAINWEYKVLQKMKVVLREDFLNKQDGKAIPSMSGDKNPMCRAEVAQKCGESYRENYKNDPSMRERKIEQQNRKEANDKRRAERKQYFSDPEKKERYVSIGYEINSRPEVMKANKEKNGGKNNAGYDPVIRTFIHKDGTCEKMTVYELRVKYNLSQPSMSSVVNGRRKSHKGWRVVFDAEKQHS
jgi:hypothetical protein